MESMALAEISVKQLAVHLRRKLGSTSIMAHKNVGYRLNPRGIVKQGVAGAHVRADVTPWARSG